MRLLSPVLWVSCVLCVPCLAAPLPGTQPLDDKDDLTTKMVAGIDKYLMRATDAALAGRAPAWKGTAPSPTEFEKSIEPLRQQLRKSLGLVDARKPVTDLELVGSAKSPALVAETDAYRVHAVRWPVLDGRGRRGPAGWSRRASRSPRWSPCRTPTGPRRCSSAWPPGCRPTSSSPAGWPRTAAGCRPDPHRPEGRVVGQRQIQPLDQPAAPGVHLPAWPTRWAGTSSATRSRRCSPPSTGSDAGRRRFRSRSGGTAREDSSPCTPGRWTRGSTTRRRRVLPASHSRRGSSRSTGTSGRSTRSTAGRRAAGSSTRPGRYSSHRAIAPDVKGPPPARQGRGGAARRASIRGFTPPQFPVAGDAGALQQEAQLDAQGEGRPEPERARTAGSWPGVVPADKLARSSPSRRTSGPVSTPPVRQNRQFDQLVAFTQKLWRDSESVRAARFWPRSTSPRPRSTRSRSSRSAKFFDEEVIGKLPAPTLPPNPKTRRALRRAEVDRATRSCSTSTPTCSPTASCCCPRTSSRARSGRWSSASTGSKAGRRTSCNPKERTQYYNSFGGPARRPGLHRLRPAEPVHRPGQVPRPPAQGQPAQAVAVLVHRPPARADPRLARHAAQRRSRADRLLRPELRRQDGHARAGHPAEATACRSARATSTSGSARTCRSTAAAATCAPASTRCPSSTWATRSTTPRWRT